MSKVEKINNEIIEAQNAVGASLAKTMQATQVALQALLNKQGADVTGIGEQLSTINATLSTLSGGLDANALADALAVTERIQEDEDLQAAIAVLQASIQTNQGLIQQVQTLVDNAEQQITDLHDSDVMLQAQITLLVSNLNALDVALRTDAAALVSRVTALETRTTASESATDALAQRVTDAEATLVDTVNTVSEIVADLAAVSVNATAEIVAGFNAETSGVTPSVTIDGVVYKLGIE